MNEILVMILTALLFLATILIFAAKPKIRSKLTGKAILVTAIGGLFAYGYGFSVATKNPLLAVVRATLAVCGMFLGKNEFSSISGVALFQNPWVQAGFWFLHFTAFYVMANAVVTTVGASAVRRLRLFLARRGDLTLIYGVNRETVEFGQQLLGEKNHSVLFVDDHPEASCVQKIKDMGCVLLTEKGAVAPNSQFLKSIGMRPGERKLSVYALNKDINLNLTYAETMLLALETAGVKPAQTALVMLGEETIMAGVSLQAKEETYGYGSVMIFNEAEMVARLLVQTYPPCKQLTFDKIGRSQEDFEALLIGFGRIGQSVLKQLVMNGQFEGGRFRASIFDPDSASVSGHLFYQCRRMFEEYRIDFYACDGRSRDMYAYLKEKGESLRYVVICTGNERKNREIADELKHYFIQTGNDVPVFQCSYGGVRETSVTAAGQMRQLYSKEVLCPETLDRMAMELNQSYCGSNGKTAVENWARTDYFSRMSSRASADFAEAILQAAGKTEEEVLSGEWKPEGALLETLGRMEHRRWCAFHYAMGFETMPGDVYESRTEQYRKEVAEKGSSSLRIGKDLAHKQHACLIPWEALDDLARKENALTGGHVNYKQMDINNVLSLPAVLRAARQAANKEDV